MADIVWMKRVWASGPTYVNDRAVLLVLVDVMSNDGHRAWPSVDTIASRVGISPRRVRDRLRSLEADGWITTESLGGGRHRSTLYVVNVGRLSTGPDEPGRNPDETRTQRPSKKPGRNPDAVTRNPDAVAQNPDAASAYRLEEGLGRGAARVQPVDNPLPGVVTQAPLPCRKHPNGWHHHEPCGRCASLREYDEQQRAAAPQTRPRDLDEMCGDCDRGWVDLDTGVAPCPNGCLDPIPITADGSRRPAPASAGEATSPGPPRKNGHDRDPALVGDVASRLQARFSNATWERRAVQRR